MPKSQQPEPGAHRRDVDSGAWIAPDGWVSTTTEDEAAVHVRVRLGSNGDLIVTGLLIEADEITTDTLRQIHPGRVLAALRPQASEKPAWIKNRGGETVLTDIPPEVDNTPGLPINIYVTPDGLLPAYAAADDSETTLASMRNRPRPKLSAAKRELLGRPSDDAAVGRPGDFYKRFASAYRSAATESSKPAMILAEENAVPVETVRRWIKEARRRGHLDPGRKGRAG